MGQVCSEISNLQQEYCKEFAVTDEHSPSHGKDQRVVRKIERRGLGLSHVGQAAVDVLRTKYDVHRGVCWNVTHGRVVGEVFQSPPNKYFTCAKIDADNETTHSDFLPEKMGEIMSRAEEWVDFTSLSQPDGKFLKHMCKALKAISDRGKPVTVRFLTGNIIGMPTDNDALLVLLTDNPEYPEYQLPADTKLRIWLGSWRKGLSWNHSKILAVDGKYLFQGGHNVWDAHYLQKNPVRDLSMEAEGRVAQDAHVFANRMWTFVSDEDRESIVQGTLPDWVPLLSPTRIGVTHWPETVGEYPPLYEPPAQAPSLPMSHQQGDVPMITIGRYGGLHSNEATANPSDAAITAMLGSAQSSIKMSVQDLGPVAVPLGGQLAPIPGAAWPKDYLREIGRAIYERGVNVDIVVSNPYSVPARLSALEANYGNGWTCEDVMAEIVNSIKELFPDYDEETLAGLVGINVKVTYVRSTTGESDWCEARKSGNHAKFFMIDDRCYYIGSQNLYIANLAEWGVVVDDEAQAQAVLEQYWRGCWASSYEQVPEELRDAKVEEVLSKLDIDRHPRMHHDFTEEELEQVLLTKKSARMGAPGNTLRVWVKRASHLADADGPFGGGSDSYVVIRVVDRAGQVVGITERTRVINNGGPNPVWNEQFTFEGLQTPASYTLKLNVWDQDSFLGLPGQLADWAAADDHLGTAEVNLELLRNTTDFQEFEPTVSKGWFQDSKLVIALNTDGLWGC